MRKWIDRMPHRMRIGLAVGACLLAAGGAARAATLASSDVAIVSPTTGTASLHSQVDDNVGGDTSRWLFTYVLSGESSLPPGTTNGWSELDLFFGGPVPDVTSQTAPAGWILNDLVEPPFGVGFDILNSAGFGVGPNAPATFSFAVPAGTGWSTDPNVVGATIASHFLDVGFGTEQLVDGLGRAPIVPVPEPGSLALVAGGLALLARRRLSSAA